MDAVIYSRIFDPTTSVVNVENADASTRLLAATTLRNVLGTKSMSEILSDRDHISAEMQVFINSIKGVMVFNATFNNISWRSVLLVEETTDLPQVADNQLNIRKALRYHRGIQKL